MRPNGRFQGLVTGLALGDNVLTARITGGPGARITLTNHPNGGPVFSGPQVQPWVCQETAVDEPPDDAAAQANGSDPLCTVLQEEAAEAVRQAIAALPPLQREAVVLFEYQEMSLADIAASCAIDVGTVKSRLHRARERLKRTLAPWLAGAPPRTPALAGERDTRP